MIEADDLTAALKKAEAQLAAEQKDGRRRPQGDDGRATAR